VFNVVFRLPVLEPRFCLRFFETLTKDAFLSARFLVFSLCENYPIMPMMSDSFIISKSFPSIFTSVPPHLDIVSVKRKGLKRLTEKDDDGLLPTQYRIK